MSGHKIFFCSWAESVCADVMFGFIFHLVFRPRKKNNKRNERIYFCSHSFITLNGFCLFTHLQGEGHSAQQKPYSCSLELDERQRPLCTLQCIRKNFYENENIRRVKTANGNNIFYTIFLRLRKMMLRGQQLVYVCVLCIVCIVPFHSSTISGSFGFFVASFSPIFFRIVSEFLIPTLIFIANKRHNDDEEA